MDHAAVRHRRLGRRRQEHADRAAAVRLEVDLRGPARGGRADLGRRRGDEYTNLALLTDGLRAEREQGITIDVAYRYFATPRRKFIIADTPGHIQYTRNMVTGASTADLAIILVDARKGLVEQSRRHAFIATLLRVPHLVLAVNKMDLVDYSQEVFEGISDEFTAFAAKLEVPDLDRRSRSRRCCGDNIVSRSREHALVRRAVAAAPPGARARRQRPQPDRRPVPGAVRDPPAVGPVPATTAATPARWPAACSSRATRSGAAVRALHPDRRDRRPLDGPVDEAFPPMSVTRPADRRPRHLPRRHDLPAAQRADRHPGRRRDGLLDGRAGRCTPGRKLTIKHTTRTVARPGQATCSTGWTSTPCTGTRPPPSSALNDIGRVRLRTTQPLFADDYRRNRATGGFILIDEATNATVGAGMIIGLDHG